MLKIIVRKQTNNGQTERQTNKIPSKLLQPGVVVHAFNPSTQEEEAERRTSGSLRWPWSAKADMVVYKVTNDHLTLKNRKR